VNPRFGTDTDRLFTPDYPVWIGADRKLSANPLPFPGKVQVSGHIQIDEPDANPVRIRIDTSGGVREPLTACVLRGPTDPPTFVFSNG
jgi:serine/threonine protein phosphatase 1